MDRRAIGSFKKNRGAMAGAAIVTFLALFALFAPLVVPHDPLASDFVNGRTDDGTPAPPSLVHPLGTDQLFRDELARLAHGARFSLEIGILASMISLFIGAAAGIVAGYASGRGPAFGPLRLGLGHLLMRVLDTAPSLPLL